MLIGSRAHFAFEILPVTPSWDKRYAPEAAAWAGLAVWVHNQNLCAHVRAGEEEVRSHLFVPLAPIADWIVRAYPALALEERAPWFQTSHHLHEMVRSWGELPPPRGMDADNWLDVREAFWSHHFLAAGADGSRLPNLAFLREDDTVATCWRPPQYVGDPRVNMVSHSGDAMLRWTEFADVLAHFVDFAADSFERAEVGFPYAWMNTKPRLSIGSSITDRLTLFCARTMEQMAALLEVSVGEVPATLGFQGVVQEPAFRASCQIIRDLSPNPSLGIGPELLDLVAQVQSKSVSRNAPWRRARELALDAARAGQTPELQGQLAAHTLRDSLGLNGQPIEDLDDILARCGVAQRPSTLQSRDERMLVAAVAEGQPTLSVLRHRRTETPWGKRFEQARALGNVMLDPERGGAIGAAGTSYAQENRRRRSGAFAAELLLPESALKKASEDRLDGAAEPGVFQSLLATYCVGARTAAYQLYNHNFLSSPIVRDELIDEYASAM